jgi:hypothetical protein
MPALPAIRGIDRTGGSCAITLAIPTRNRLPLLKRAVESCLAQDLPDLEVVISDNASSDGTAEWGASLADPRIRFSRHQADVGMYANWNACLAAARAPLFLLLSDDDWLEPGAAGALVEALRARPSCFAAVCEFTCHDVASGTARTTRRPPGESPGLSFLHEIVDGRMLFPCGIALRTAALRLIGGYDQDDGLCADFAVLVKLALGGGTVCNLGIPLAHYWSATTNASAAGTAMAEAIDACVDRLAAILPAASAWQEFGCQLLRFRRRFALHALVRMVITGAPVGAALSAYERVAPIIGPDPLRQSLALLTCLSATLPAGWPQRLRDLATRLRRPAAHPPLAGPPP